MEERSKKKDGKRLFWGIFWLLFALNAGAYLLTLSLPTGAFDRPEGGRTLIPGSYNSLEIEPVPLHTLVTAPFEIIAGRMGSRFALFFLVICAAVSKRLIERGGYLVPFSRGLSRSFGKKGFLKQSFFKPGFLLLAALSLFLMAASSFFGSYRALAALVILISPLSAGFGFEPWVGPALTYLSLAFGAAIPITAPSSIGIAQTLAGLPLFSGLGYRLVCFFLLYGMLCVFFMRKARLPAPDEAGPQVSGDERERPRQKKASLFLILCASAASAYSLASSLLPGLNEEGSLIVMGILLAAGGLGGWMINGLGAKELLSCLFKGIAGGIPFAALIAMAESVPYLLNRGGVNDTILLYLSDLPVDGPGWIAALWVFLYSVLAGFVLPGGSSRIFQHLPLLLSLSGLAGVSRQCMILGSFLGGGLADILFPVQSLLILVLCLSGMSYPSWLRRVLGAAACMAGLSLLMVCIAQLIGYGPL